MIITVKSIQDDQRKTFSVEVPPLVLKSCLGSEDVINCISEYVLREVCRRWCDWSSVYYYANFLDLLDRCKRGDYRACSELRRKYGRDYHATCFSECIESRRNFITAVVLMAFTNLSLRR